MPEILNSCHNELLIVPYLASLSLVSKPCAHCSLHDPCPSVPTCCPALSSSSEISTCLGDCFFQSWSHCSGIIILTSLSRQLLLELQAVSESQLYIFQYLTRNSHSFYKYLLNKWAQINEYYNTYIDSMSYCKPYTKLCGFVHMSN